VAAKKKAAEGSFPWEVGGGEPGPAGASVIGRRGWGFKQEMVLSTTPSEPKGKIPNSRRGLPRGGGRATKSKITNKSDHKGIKRRKKQARVSKGQQTGVN